MRKLITSTSKRKEARVLSVEAVGFLRLDFLPIQMTVNVT